MRYRVDSDVHLQFDEVWKMVEPRFSFIGQLVEVIREANANETSEEDGLVLLGSPVRVYQ